MTGSAGTAGTSSIEAKQSLTHRVVLPVGMALFVLLIYLTSLDIPRQADDAAALRQNIGNQVPTPVSLRLWTRPYHDGLGNDPNLYRPVTVFTYWLGDRLISSGLIQLRAVNLVILALLGWAIASWFGRYVHPFAAWLAAGLFVAHPSNASNIHHIVGRADLLAMLGAVGFLLAQRAAFARGRWQAGHALFAMFFAAMAFGAKETGLLLAPVAIVQAWRLRTEKVGGAATSRTRLRAMGALYLLLPLALYLAARVYSVGWWQPYASGPDDITGNPLRGVGFFERLPAALGAAWFYFRRTFLPLPGADYEAMAVSQWGSLSAWLGIAVLVLSIALLAKAWRRRQWVIVGMLFAFGQYLLVSNLITPAGVYVSADLTVPFVFSATATIAWLVARKTVGSPRRRAVAVLLFLVIGSGMIAMVQWKAFHPQDPIRLLEARVERDETDVQAQYLLAQHRREQAMRMTDPAMREQRLRAVATQLERAADHAPDSIQICFALTQVYEEAGRHQDASYEAAACRKRVVAFLMEHPHNRPAREIYEELKERWPPLEEFGQELGPPLRLDLSP